MARLKFWVAEVRRVEPKCRIYIAATKLDLVSSKRERAVDYHDTTDLVDEVGAQLFEVRLVYS